MKVFKLDKNNIEEVFFTVLPRDRVRVFYRWRLSPTNPWTPRKAEINTTKKARSHWKIYIEDGFNLVVEGT